MTSFLRGGGLRQALSGKQSLAALQELLAEAAAKGAEETSLADGLRKRIAGAEEWEQRANAFFASATKHQLKALEVRPDVLPRHPSSRHESIHKVGEYSCTSL